MQASPRRYDEPVPTVRGRPVDTSQLRKIPIDRSKLIKASPPRTRVPDTLDDPAPLVSSPQGSPKPLTPRQSVTQSPTSAVVPSVRPLTPRTSATKPSTNPPTPGNRISDTSAPSQHRPEYRANSPQFTINSPVHSPHQVRSPGATKPSRSAMVKSPTARNIRSPQRAPQPPVPTVRHSPVRDLGLSGGSGLGVGNHPGGGNSGAAMGSGNGIGTGNQQSNMARTPPSPRLPSMAPQDFHQPASPDPDLDEPGDEDSDVEDEPTPLRQYPEMSEPLFDEPNFDAMEPHMLEMWGVEIDNKFNTLITTYPNMRITRPTTPIVKYRYRIYRFWLKRVQSNINRDQNRVVAYAYFYGVEYIFTKWLGLDLTGYAQRQIEEFNRYQDMLVELGEYNYLSIDQNYHPLVRFLFTSTIQMVLFLVVKYVSKWSSVAGAGADLFRSVLTPIPELQPVIFDPTQQPGQSPAANPNQQPVNVPEPVPGNGITSVLANAMASGNVNSILGSLGSLVGGGSRPAPPRPPMDPT